MDLAHAFVRYAEHNLDCWVQEELSSRKPRPNLYAA